MPIHRSPLKPARRARPDQRGEPIRIGVGGKAAMDFCHTGDAHDSRRKFAGWRLLADEPIEQPAEAREVVAGARWHDRSGHQMGGRMKADEVDPRTLRHRIVLALRLPGQLSIDDGG